MSDAGGGWRPERSVIVAAGARRGAKDKSFDAYFASAIYQLLKRVLSSVRIVIPSID